MALVAGVQAPPGRIMGHAGALFDAGEVDARQKADLLRDAGAVITNHPSKFGHHMIKLLNPAKYSCAKVGHCALLGLSYD